MLCLTGKKCNNTYNAGQQFEANKKVKSSLKMLLRNDVNLLYPYVQLRKNVEKNLIALLIGMGCILIWEADR